MEADPVQQRRRRFVLFALWGCGLGVLIVFRSVVVYFATAALIAFLAAPLVDRLSGLSVGGARLPRWASILAIYLLFFCAAYVAVIALLPQLYRELGRVSREAVAYANSLTPDRVQALAERGETWLYAHGLPVALSSRALEGAESSGHAFGLSLDVEHVLHDVAEKAKTLIQENLGDIVSVSRRVVGGVLAAVFMLFFMLMLAAYMSIDASAIAKYVRSLIPPEYAADARVLWERIDRSLAGVVRGQVIICLVNGVLTLVGLLVFGVKFAFLLATVATLLSLIPIFGSIISSVPIVAIGLSQSFEAGLAMLGWIIGIHTLEAYVLNPKIMGSAARIHPVVVAFALLAGERTFGLVGALFAVPIAAIAVACFDFARLKAQPAPSPEALRSLEQQSGAEGVAALRPPMP